ncbi:DciA family protein [Streptomyces sp. NPDC096013]|uniref:DciA family protein n=1 Tax=Streptomyces sp. NPDC096013 TaxID=3366069 RepID=UPI0038293877
MRGAPGDWATLRERWAAIASELAGHVTAVSCDAASGRLPVRPESSAWATKARLEQTQIIAANTSAGRALCWEANSPASYALRPRCTSSGNRPSAKPGHPMVAGLRDVHEPEPEPWSRRSVNPK